MDKKPRIEQLANEISGYFSSIILFLALATFGVWLALSGSFEHSLVVAISVVVIACPCALGLATPVATLVGIGRAAKRGILFKEASYLESIAKCDSVVLDKTGTITKGKPEVIKQSYKMDFDKKLLYSLVSLSSHPVSQGIKELLKNEQITTEYELEEVKTIEAKGVKAKYNGLELAAGNRAFMLELGLTCKEEFEEYTQLYFALDKKIVAVFGLQDKPRDGAKETISFLKKSGLKVVMLTGDNEKVAQKIAQEVGIEKVKSGLLPIEKAEFIRQLKDEGKKVVMVGDGINDTLALSNSQVAITLGSGTDIAVNVSDVVLMNESFEGLKEVFQISKNTFNIVKQNLAFSILYNVITIPLAMAGYVIPLVAAISMSFSSLIVVTNSMRIK
jgi:Cu+-exporting ATPase